VDRHADSSSDTRVDNVKIKIRAAAVSITAAPPAPPALVPAVAPPPGIGALSGRVGVLDSLAGCAGRGDPSPSSRSRGTGGAGTRTASGRWVACGVEDDHDLTGTGRGPGSPELERAAA
jgi:hypothetical protein